MIIKKYRNLLKLGKIDINIIRRISNIVSLLIRFLYMILNLCQWIYFQFCNTEMEILKYVNVENK